MPPGKVGKATVPSSFPRRGPRGGGSRSRIARPAPALGAFWGLPMRRCFVVLTLLLILADPAQALGLLRRMMWAGAEHDLAVDCGALPDQSKLVISFVAPPNVSSLEGIEAYVDVHTGGSQIPAWWLFGSSFGACRADSLSVLPDFPPGSSSHPSPWNGRGQATFDYQSFIAGTPVSARIVVRIRPSPGDPIALEPFRE